MSITVGAKIIENDLWMLASSIALELTIPLWMVPNETNDNYNVQNVKKFQKDLKTF